MMSMPFALLIFATQLLYAPLGQDTAPVCISYIWPSEPFATSPTYFTQAEAQLLSHTLQEQLANRGLRLQIGNCRAVALSFRLYIQGKQAQLVPDHDESRRMEWRLKQLSPILATPDLYNIAINAQSAPSAIALAIGYYSGRCDLIENAPPPDANPRQIGDNDYQLFRGDCALLDGDYEQAILYLERALQHPTEPLLADTAIIHLAWAYLQSGQADLAFSSLDSYFQRLSLTYSSKNLAFLYARRAQLYALAFDYDAARTDINQALSFLTNHPELYAIRGDIHMLTYEWDEAMDDYNRAIRRCSTCARPYFARGVLFYTRADRDAARADFERYLQLAPLQDPYVSLANRYIASIQTENSVLPGP